MNNRIYKTQYYQLLINISGIKNSYVCVCRYISGVAILEIKLAGFMEN